jgi:hypothetical protein
MRTRNRMRRDYEEELEKEERKRERERNERRMIRRRRGSMRTRKKYDGEEKEVSREEGLGEARREERFETKFLIRSTKRVKLKSLRAGLIALQRNLWLEASGRLQTVQIKHFYYTEALMILVFC